MKRSPMIKNIFYARTTTIFSHKFWFVLFLLVTWNEILAIRFNLAISNDDATITLYDNHNNRVGFVSYKKIPITSWYIIHSLYVYPKFRRKGYGSALIKQMCKLLKDLHATRIYIQPGPFELNNKPPIKGNSYKEKMKELIKFYKKLGFKYTNSIVSAIAAVVYFFSGIHENSRYLMTKSI